MARESGKREGGEFWCGFKVVGSLIESTFLAPLLRGEGCAGLGRGRRPATLFDRRRSRHAKPKLTRSWVRGTLLHQTGFAPRPLPSRRKRDGTLPLPTRVGRGLARKAMLSFFIPSRTRLRRLGRG